MDSTSPNPADSFITAVFDVALLDCDWTTQATPPFVARALGSESSPVHGLPNRDGHVLPSSPAQTNLIFDTFLERNQDVKRSSFDVVKVQLLFQAPSRKLENVNPGAKLNLYPSHPPDALVPTVPTIYQPS